MIDCLFVGNWKGLQKYTGIAGRLMRTILYSTEHVSANNWETALFILFLMVFAIAASAYVLYHGLQASCLVLAQFACCTTSCKCLICPVYQHAIFLSPMGAVIVYKMHLCVPVCSSSAGSKGKPQQRIMCRGQHGTLLLQAY